MGKDRANPRDVMGRGESVVGESIAGLCFRREVVQTDKLSRTVKIEDVNLMK